MNKHGRESRVKFSKDKSNVLIVNRRDEQIERNWALGYFEVKQTGAVLFMKIGMTEQ